MKIIIYIILLFNFLIISGSDVFAQKTRVTNLEKYEKQKLHFGFLLGINSSNFKVKLASNFYNLDSVIVLEPHRQSGFNLGIISDLKLSDYFNFRFTPELAFSQRDLYYTMTPGLTKTPVIVKKVESTFLNFPVDLKFKSARVGNYRLYVLAGFRYAIDMVSQAKVENDKEVIVRLKKNDYGYEIGFGIDCYLEMFKFAPEIKMFQGIPNVLVPSNDQFSTSISSLKSRVFSLSLTFE